MEVPGSGGDEIPCHGAGVLGVDRLSVIVPLVQADHLSAPQVDGGEDLHGFVPSVSHRCSLQASSAASSRRTHTASTAPSGKVQSLPAGGLAHDGGQAPALLRRVLHHADGPLSDDAAERGGVAAGLLRPLEGVAGVQLEPGPAVLPHQIHLPALAGAVDIEHVAAVLQHMAEIHRHHVDALPVLKAQPQHLAPADDRADLLRGP